MDHLCLKGTSCDNASGARGTTCDDASSPGGQLVATYPVVDLEGNPRDPPLLAGPSTNKY